MTESRSISVVASAMLIVVVVGLLISGTSSDVSIPSPIPACPTFRPPRRDVARKPAKTAPQRGNGVENRVNTHVWG